MRSPGPDAPNTFELFAPGRVRHRDGAKCSGDISRFLGPSRSMRPAPRSPEIPNLETGTAENGFHLLRGSKARRCSSFYSSALGATWSRSTPAGLLRPHRAHDPRYPASQAYGACALESMGIPRRVNSFSPRNGPSQPRNRPCRYTPTPPLDMPTKYVITFSGYPGQKRSRPDKRGCTPRSCEARSITGAFGSGHAHPRLALEGLNVNAFPRAGRRNTACRNRQAPLPIARALRARAKRRSAAITKPVGFTSYKRLIPGYEAPRSTNAGRRQHPLRARGAVPLSKSAKIEFVAHRFFPAPPTPRAIPISRFLRLIPRRRA